MDEQTIEALILSEFYDIITENKKQMFDRIAAQRTKHVTVVLENIYQEHNASAVIRSCDCFGIQELHVIEKKEMPKKIEIVLSKSENNWHQVFKDNL